MRARRRIPFLATALSLFVVTATATAQERQEQEEQQQQQQQQGIEAASLITGGPNEASFNPIPGFPQGTDLAVLRGNPEEGPFDAYIRLQPGTRIPTHFHTSAESSVGVQGDFTLEMQNGETITLDTGRYTFIPWEMPHAASCPDGGEECIGYFSFDRAFDVTWVEGPPENPNPAPGGESR